MEVFINVLEFLIIENFKKGNAPLKRGAFYF